MFKKIRIIAILIIICMLGFMFSGTFMVSQVKPGDELNFNIVEKGLNSSSINANYLAFSSEDVFINYYAKLKNLKAPRPNMNPGINFDYNMAVILTMGEKHINGYDINLKKAEYLGDKVNIFYDENIPESTSGKNRVLHHPYCVASVYYDKEIRENAKIISFINEKSGKLTTSIPIVKTKKYPYYEIPEEVRSITVEKGDYGNFEDETYIAFNHHIPFNAAYMKLKENKEYRVRPPELSFLGNIVVMMSLGEKENGGYKILANDAYTNVYMLGDSLYVMVRKIAPTDHTIRYYDITRPYSIASIQIGTRWKYLNYVHFIDETTGEQLRKVKLKKIR